MKLIIKIRSRYLQELCANRVTFILTHKYMFYLYLKFLLNDCHFEIRWLSKLSIKIRSRFLQELHTYHVLSKSVHKYVFYMNFNFLNGHHFETQWPSKLNIELGWAFGKDFMHSNFHSNWLINTFFIWIWNF